MQDLGPSLLNALQELLISVPHVPTARRDLVRPDSPLLGGYELHFVLQVLQNCKLIFLDVEDTVHVTVPGRNLAKSDQPHINRELILLLLENYRPAWAKLIPRGRRECLPNLPSRVAQCLIEAGLGDTANDEIRLWWQRASRLARYFGNSISAEVGDAGEQCSLRLEKERVGIEPQHIALETTWAGYDILSFVESGSSNPLRIEVKASSQRKSEANFFVTRNEWSVATSAPDYLFHLWLVSEGTPPRVARLKVSDVESHIPGNRGTGQWETTKIPFHLFEFEEMKSWGPRTNEARPRTN